MLKPKPMRCGLTLALLFAMPASTFAVPEAPPQQRLAARELPPLLQMSDGTPVTSPAQWPARRAQIVDVLESQLFGRAPQVADQDVRFAVTKIDRGALGGAATLKQIKIAVDGPRGTLSYELILFTPNAPRANVPGANVPGANVPGANVPGANVPGANVPGKNASRKAAPRAGAPTMLLVSHRGASNLDPTRAEKTEFWPVEALIARGYGAAAFLTGSVAPDEDDGFQNGVHAIFEAPRKPGETRAPDAWGTLAAWAWGASRALDYLLSDPDVDGQHVGVVGHSRGGKTALWAGASDPRFALVVSNCSGQSGAALSRGKQGESLARINTKFPHWFDANYKQYNDRPEALPFDQHWLMAAIAPRPLYVVSAQEDNWADPTSEFLGALAAAPAYQLLGKPGLVADGWPRTDEPLQSGTIGYHRRSGKHDLTLYDWTQVMNFADTKWKTN